MPEPFQPLCFGYYHADATSPEVAFETLKVDRSTIPVLPKDGILLIDDSEDDAELSLRALCAAGLQVPIAWIGDSTSAIDALESATPQSLPRLVLLDLRMPCIDGFETLRRMRDNPRTRALSVIVMVGSARAPELPRCYSLGANSYVVKPLRRDSFFAACARAALEWPRNNLSDDA